MKYLNRIKKAGFALISFIVLIIVSLVVSLNDNTIGSIMSIISCIGVIISAIYSFIPIYQYYKIKDNERKNRLSDSTFTDRYSDIKYILEKLSTKEKSIEITGKDAQCGKSWLAKKVCDFINYSSDEEYGNLKHNKIQKVIKKAYYIDMKEKDENDINDFLENHIINYKIVLIFDHVLDLSYIITKQNLYHFQLIYILENDTNSENLYQHVISDFNKNDIPLLQNKIKKNHSKLDKITKKETEVLFDLTNGNIGKIYAILSCAEYIGWIKNIANDINTDYDIKLNEIQLNLYVGEYEKARNLINNFNSSYSKMYDKNNDLLFKIKLLESDCEHLLNNYENALAILLPLKRKDLNFANNNYTIELHEAHYYKHLWKCNEALILLKSIETNSFSGLVDSLGILTSKYFIDDLHIPYSNDSTLETYRKKYIQAYNSNLVRSDEENLKLHRHECIYKFYFGATDKKELIKIATDVIELYKARNSRLLANAYFIRAELYRMYKDYEKTILDYQRCASITNDNNIKIQTSVMMYYLEKIKKVQSIDFPEYMTKEKIISTCRNKNKYGEILVAKINSIELNDPTRDKIIECFDTRIMTIL